MAKDPTLSRIELLQGTLDLIVLQTLRWGPCHGYGIAQMIRAPDGKHFVVVHPMGDPPSLTVIPNWLSGVRSKLVTP